MIVGNLAPHPDEQPAERAHQERPRKRVPRLHDCDRAAASDVPFAGGDVTTIGGAGGRGGVKQTNTAAAIG
jgi:hypothetical protein